MNSGKWIYAKLTADATVSGLVSTRVRPVRARQGEAKPYVVYQRSFTNRQHTFTGADGLPTAYFRIWCYAESMDDAETLASAVKSALDGVRGTAGGVVAQGCFVIDDADDLDEPADGAEVGDPFVAIEVRLVHQE